MDKKYVLLILNCKKYEFKKNIQKNGWLKKLPLEIDYYHVIGDELLCKEKKYIFDNSNNILYVNTEDTYMSLPHKVISAIEAVR